jgi:drug/metabolite transporter (DMT)-like permease
METPGWSSFYGILKIVGMVIAVGGAVLLSFTNSMGSSKETSSGGGLGGHKSPVLLFLSSVAWSLWLIVQPKLLKQYPARLRLSTLQCLLSSVQATVAAVALQRNFDSWKIGWNIQLASLAYCVCLHNIFFLTIFFMFFLIVVGLMACLNNMKGVLVTGASYGLQIWCIEKKGPFYAAMFSPLSLLITAIFSAFVWAERLRWGRFVTSFFFCYVGKATLGRFSYRSCACYQYIGYLGGIMIVGGLYSVLWGRSKEGTQQMLKSEPPAPGEKSKDVERS